MAGKIRVTPEELRRSSRTFKTSASNTKTMLGKLAREVNQMSNAWEGAAQNAFFREFNELKPSLNKFVTVLEGISKQLSDVARTMEDVDKDIASKLRR
ncbi:MAG: WXG100 family type VII secretion target [Clostridium sp.]|nr:WXG100 family type VII secretion target [Clostridium sp.]